MTEGKGKKVCSMEENFLSEKAAITDLLYVYILHMIENSLIKYVRYHYFTKKIKKNCRINKAFYEPLKAKLV